MSVKSFSTASKQKRAPGLPSGESLPDVPFTLDGVDYLAQGPKDISIAVLVAGTAEARTQPDRVAAFLDFFEAVLAEPGRQVFRKRMLDPRDPLDLGKVIEVFNYLLEQWGGQAPTSASA